MKLLNKRTFLMVLVLLGAPFLLIYAVIIEDRGAITEFKNLLKDIIRELTNGN